jgi:hypothetical protein
MYLSVIYVFNVHLRRIVESKCGRKLTTEQSIIVIKLLTNLNDGDQESLFVFLLHGSGNGSDGPTKRVQVFPGPFVAIHL